MDIRATTRNPAFLSLLKKDFQQAQEGKGEAQDGVASFYIRMIQYC
jgi:hypothetical protein